MNTTNLERNSVNKEISFGVENFYSVKSSTLVKLHESITLLTETGSKTLMVEITSDFDTIPSEYHEVFLNMLTSKYLNRVSYGDNPFSNCTPMKKKRWWQFWRNY